MPTETRNEMRIELTVTMVDQPASTAISRDRPTPTSRPITPPQTAIMIVSTRNCRTMSVCLAPMARRIPISRVRSRTLASMMFMMPMPPTSSEIDASATMTKPKIRCVRRCSASSAAGTTSEKSSVSRCEALRMPRTTSAVRIISLASAICR